MTKKQITRNGSQMDGPPYQVSLAMIITFTSILIALCNSFLISFPLRVLIFLKKWMHIISILLESILRVSVKEMVI